MKNLKNFWKSLGNKGKLHKKDNNDYEFVTNEVDLLGLTGMFIHFVMM